MRVAWNLKLYAHSLLLIQSAGILIRQHVKPSTPTAARNATVTRSPGNRHLTDGNFQIKVVKTIQPTRQLFLNGDW